MKKQLLPRFSNGPKATEVKEVSGKDIAIVGMALKVAGADTLDDFWSNLCRGEEWIREAPANRIPSNKDDTDRHQLSLAGYLSEVDKFDSTFFRIPPKEADLMDPYQRLFLETAWSAIEDGGYGGERLKGSRTGVYIGSGHEHEYKQMIASTHPEWISQAAVSNLPPVIASRISYLLDLKGPSLLVDTACSSSLIAVHLACQALALRECDMAIAGGIQLMLDLSAKQPQIGIESENSAIRAFDADADGTVRGEGVGAILLKPLSQAIADKDPIYAVIKGSVSNQDGKSIGITSPNMSAQEQLLLDAWEKAGIDPATLSYIEAHGTGTPIGDPIEIQAIQNAFRKFTDRAQFCAIGTVKPNIGHLYHAAGIIGLIKSALSLAREQIPPSLNFESPNSRIDFAQSPVYVNTILSDWKRSEEARRCGISSFGMSGTNCHVILEEAPASIMSSPRNEEQNLPILLTLSARSCTSLKSQIENLRLHLIMSPASEFRDICYSLNVGRGHYEYSLAICASHPVELKEKLAALQYMDFEFSFKDPKLGVWFGEPDSRRINAEDDIITSSTGENDNRWEKAAFDYTNGYAVDWNTLYVDQSRKIVSAPTYAFDKHRHWLSSAIPMAPIVNQKQVSSKSEEDSIEMQTKKVNESESKAITNQVAKIIADVSGYDSMDTHKSFMEMGMDSILLVNVRHALKDYFEVDIPMRRFFEDLSTIEEVSNYITQTGGKSLDLSSTETIVSASITYDRHEKEASTDSDKTTVPTTTSNIALNSGYESIIHKQLHLMEQQLRIMSSGSTMDLPATPHSFSLQESSSVSINYAPTKEQIKDRPYVPYQKLEMNMKSMFTPQQQYFLDTFIAKYTAKTRKSQLHTQSYREVVANNRNVAGFRPYWKDMVYQIVVDRATGAKIHDIDGNEYIDLTMGFGVNLFGHHAPFIDVAIQEALHKGMCLGPINVTAGKVASAIKELTGMERSAFFNSGTEAIMVAARLARAATGKPKIVIFSGSYHGTFDGILAMNRGSNNEATPLAPGIPSSMIGEVIVLNYGHPDSLKVIEKNAHELAAVLVEPVQSRKPDLQPETFLKELRDVTAKHQVALIFDEVITGFRIHPGGAQAWFGVKADIAVYGKVVGGGLPIGIVSGKSKFLDGIDGGMWQFGDQSVPPEEQRRTFVAGTFCQHPLAMNASLAVLQHLQQEGPGLQEELNRNTKWLADTLNAYFIAEQLPLSIVHFGSLFRLVQQTDIELLYYVLIEKGLYIWEGRNCFLSTTHTQEDMESIISIFKTSIEELRQAGFLPPSPDGGNKRSIQSETIVKNIHSPLTEEQRQLWFVSQAGKDNQDAYKETAILKLSGSMNSERLKTAMRKVISRHDMLRTTFAEDGSVQTVNNAPELDLYFNWFEASTNHERIEISDLENYFPGIEERFDLAKGPFIRLGMLHSGTEQHWLLIRVHHMAVDGWSFIRIIEELAGYYTQGESYYPPGATSFNDYMNWRKAIPGKDQVRAKQYWKSKHDVLLPDMCFPGNGMECSEPLMGKRSRTTINSQLTSELREFSRNNGFSLFMVMLAAYNKLLSKIIGTSNVIVGVPVSGQLTMGASHLVGQCVNLLPFISEIPSSITLQDYMWQMRGEFLECLEHQDCSYADIIKELSLETATLRLPVIRTIFNFDKPAIFYFDHMKATFESSPVSELKYPFSLNVLEMEQELILEWEISNFVSDSENTEAWIETYAQLLQELVSEKESKSTSLHDEAEAEFEQIVSTSECNHNQYVGLYGTVQGVDGVPSLPGVAGQLLLFNHDTSDVALAAIRQAKGGIHILGRMDRLIRFGGYQIHLNQIEQSIQAHTDIETVLLLELDGAERRLLTVFFTDENGNGLNEERLRTYMASILPASLLPTNWIPIEKKLPRNERGEINYDDLNDYSKRMDALPEEILSSMQAVIRHIWQEVLEKKMMRLNDSFISLGGNSLAATLIAAKLERELKVVVPLSFMFQYPTIAKLAIALEGKQKKSLTNSILSAEEADGYLLAPNQLPIFTEEKLGTAGTAYHVTGLVKVDGYLDIKKLQEAAQQLIYRHESLRTSFHMEEDSPVLRIHNKCSIEIPVRRYIRDVEVEAMNTIQPFELESAPLLRIEVWMKEEEPATRYLLIDLHHLIADGISAHIIVEELLHLYEGRTLPMPSIHQKDYSQWLLGRVGAGYMRDSEKYWKTQLEGDLPRLDLITDFQRTPTLTNKGEQYSIAMSPDVLKSIRKYTSCNEITLYNYVLTAFNILLSSYTNQDDLIIGTSVSGRIHAEIERIPGMFVHTIPLRNSLNKSESFAQLIRNIQANTLEAFEHQEFPLERLLLNTEMDKEIGRNPWFDVVFLYQHADLTAKSIQVGDTTFTASEYKSLTSKFDLTLEVIEAQDQLILMLEYRTELFEPETIETMADHLLTILESVAAQPDICISDIELLTNEEKKQLLHDHNCTEGDYSEDRTICNLFEEQVGINPDAVAVSDQKRNYTYAEINKSANRIALLLKQAGVTRDVPVGLVMQRSHLLVAAMLGVWKAGGCYVPIDPTYPKDRVAYIISDSGIACVITDEANYELSEFSGYTINAFEAVENGQLATDDLNIEAQANDLAYIIYTSGSTGKPKGVMVEHRGLSNYICWANQTYVRGDIISFPLYSSISFDLTVTSIFTPLISGNRLIIYPEAIEIALERIIQEGESDIIKLTPSHLKLLHLYNTKRSKLKRFIVGGEALESSAAREIVRLFGNDIEIYNEYGPTETVVGCMIHLYDPSTERNQVPIGKPIDNTRVYIVNAQGRLQAKHIPGELWIAGHGVARGYMNKAALTKERFISGKFGERGNVYRTGDLVRWLPDGSMEYMGRLDQQVKINGYRIEIGEIQNLMLQHPLVQEAAVTAQLEADGSQRLYAYYTSNQPLSGEQLQLFLSTLIPTYMLPAVYMRMNELPLSANGKLDYKKLSQSIMVTHDKQESTEPTNPLEMQLLNIWRTVLKAPNAGLEDHFVQQGGDSIKAIQIAAKMKKQGFRLETADILRGQTVRGIVQLLMLKQTEQEMEDEPTDENLRLAPIQQWFFEQQFRQMNHWNQSVTLQWNGHLDEKRIQQTLERLVKYHDVLQMRFEQASDQTITQRNSGFDPAAVGFKLHTGILTSTDEVENHLHTFNERAELITQAHQAIDLAHGPLLQAVHWKSDDSDELTIIIHHLVVDAVSWQIILDDFYDIYTSLETGKEPMLPAKTNSYQHYSNMMQKYAKSLSGSEELSYWKEQLSHPTSQAFYPNTTGNGTVRDADFSVLHFTRGRTEQILHLAAHDKLDIPTLLLTSLGYALAHHDISQGIWVQMEGHGREALVGNPDFSRTVGWFTSHYPIYLDVESAVLDPIQYAASLQAELNRIPHKGAGYNAIKYGEAGFEHPKLPKISPAICFNYLGELNDEAYHSLFHVMDIPLHGTESLDSHRLAPLIINAIMKENRLLIEVDYNQQEFSSEWIQDLLNNFLSGLSTLITSEESIVSANQQQPQLTSLLSKEEIDALKLVSSPDTEKAYPLSPMQEGMLFQHLRYPESPAYFEQCIMTFKGKLDSERMRDCFQLISNRHEILRTSFVIKGLDRPLQLVAHNIKVNFHMDDLTTGLTRESANPYHSDLENAQKIHDRLASFIEDDRAMLFNLEDGVPMRVALLQTDQEEYRLIWSFHHILLDGWSVGIILQEWFELYSKINLHSGSFEPAPAYSNYIEWITSSHRQEAEAYWAEYVRGYENKPLLPKELLQRDTPYAEGELKHVLSDELYQKLIKLSSEQHITLNSIFQTAWAVTLQKQNETEDVIFGTVVSGRTSEIQQIDEMTGLFINTIPVRVKVGNHTFLDTAARLQKEMFDKESFSYVPLSTIQNMEQKTTIDHVLVFENYPLQLALPHGVQVVDYEWRARTNYDFNLVIEPLDDLSIKFIYNRAVFDSEELQYWLSSFVFVLKQVVEDSTLSLHDILFEENLENETPAKSTIEFHF